LIITMIKQISFLLLVLCTIVWATQEDQAEFIGRWFSRTERSLNVQTTIAQGSEIRTTSFNATTVLATFVRSQKTTISPIIAISIDEKPYVRITLPNTDIANVTIAENMDASKTHNIRIVIAGIHEHDPVWQNGAGVSFYKFYLPNGGQLRPLVSSKKRILFIGDSITAGILARGRQGGSLPINSAGEANYAHVACDILDTLPLQDAFGATGAVVSGSGGVPDARTHAFYYMNDIPITKEVADMILINIGVNDQGRGISHDKFHIALLELVNHLKRDYISAKIVLIIPFNNAMRDAIIATANETGVNTVDTKGWRLTFTDGLHPDLNGHLVAGTNLAAALKALL
jgi:lysophospholipase L1-like esterase